MALPSPSLDASRAMSNFTRISGPDGVGIRTPFGKAPSSFISNFSLVSLHIALHTPSCVQRHVHAYWVLLDDCDPMVPEFAIFPSSFASFRRARHLI